MGKLALWDEINAMNMTDLAGRWEELTAALASIDEIEMSADMSAVTDAMVYTFLQEEGDPEFEALYGEPRLGTHCAKNPGNVTAMQFQVSREDDGYEGYDALGDA